MAKKVMIEHAATGMVKEGYFGFSWTYLFFGCLVPAFRGEISIAVLHFIFSLLTLGIFQIFMCWLYNKQYMTRAVEKGWKIVDSDPNAINAKIALGIRVTAPAAQAA